MQPRADALHARPARRHRAADRDQGLPAAGRDRARRPERRRASSAPVNHSYGLQLALAWDQPAAIGTRIPAASGDVTRASRRSRWARRSTSSTRATPSARADAIWNPAPDDPGLLDRRSPTRPARRAPSPPRSPRYGNALHQTTGGRRPTRTHIVLNQIRVPLADFAAQGVDLTSAAQARAALRRRRQAGDRLDPALRRPLPGGRRRAPTVYTDKLADVPPTAPAGGDRRHDGCAPPRAPRRPWPPPRRRPPRRRRSADDGVHRRRRRSPRPGWPVASWSLKGAVGCATTVQRHDRQGRQGQQEQGRAREDRRGAPGRRAPSSPRAATR